MPSSKQADGSSASSALPRKLQGLTARTEVLEQTKADRLLAAASSRKRGASALLQSQAAVAAAPAGEALPRESIAALYGLATRLHSSHLVYHAKSIETSAEKHVTTDQIWGQMSVLLRPVLRRLQDNVRHAERVYGGGAGKSGATTGSSSGGSRRPQARAIDDEDSDGDSNGGAEDADAQRATKAVAGAESLSDLSEDDLDDAIATLLKEQKRRKQAKTQKRQSGSKGDDAWRYAFGKGGEEDDEEDDEEEGGDRAPDMDDWGDGEDARGDEGDDIDGRMLDRNARAMRAAAAGDAEEDEDDAAEEELAALKEMYGDDFEDDGEGMLGGEEEDPDLEKDLYYDDPARDGDAAFAEDEDRYYNEERDGARFWGKDDMLNEEEALHSYGGEVDDEMPDDPTQVGLGGGIGDNDAGEPVDEELERALADPNLTELERERLLEKKHVEKLEQQRLFGTDWAMAGETAATRRPREALLDVDDLEFDYGMKAVPVITEAFTAKLEDRIKQRILDKRYDDVQRRAAFTTADDLVTTRKDAALDSEKSKLSLMDLYEKEYMEKMRLAEEAAGAGAPSAEPLTEIERDELRAINMWKRLSQHLDALSNFYYTPKPVQQDLEARVRAVDGAAPAITLESVGNFAASRESALAPQDLYRGSSRKFADVGSEEMKPEERRALRRAKKEEGKKFTERKEQRKQQQIKAKEAMKKVQAA